MPLENARSMRGDNGLEYCGETVVLNEKDGILTVNGQSYGNIKQGDTVDLTAKGTVSINGQARRPK